MHVRPDSPRKLTELPVTEESELCGLLRAHGQRVFRSLRYLGVREADVADASQDVFLIMHRRLAEFRGDSKLETWLYGICLGVARNRRRQQLRAARHLSSQDELPELPDAADHEAELDQKRLRARLRRALDRLSPEQREVFVLREIEELEMAAVAKTMGSPLFTAYSRLRLARRNLARLLADEEGVSR